MLRSLFAAAAITGSFYAAPETERTKRTESFHAPAMHHPKHVDHTASPGITAEYDAKKKTVTVKWQQKTSGIKIFIVQRSKDNFTWTDIARMENLQFNGAKAWQYADIKPGKGENYYRLQCTTSSGKTELSNSVMVITENAHNWVIYPVPVNDVLTLQYKGDEKITGVINVHIQNIQGTFFNRLRYASNSTIIKIPVSNLGRGIYDVRIIIEEEVVWNQRFVK